MKNEFYVAQVLTVCCVYLAFGAAMKPGGISNNEQPITRELATTFASVNTELLETVAAQSGVGSNGEKQTATPVAYKSQVVAGVNYFVKYHFMPADEYFHARIFKGLQGQVELVRVVGPKAEDDPIEYF